MRRPNACLQAANHLNRQIKSLRLPLLLDQKATAVAILPPTPFHRDHKQYCHYIHTPLSNCLIGCSHLKSDRDDTCQIETQTTLIASTPRPTRTPIPTLGAPFALTGQETVCDPNLPDGLLQVIVLNSNRRQMAGMKIMITWDGGEEQFFTGLKPELGNGYADYIMTPNITYTVQLGAGSDIASGLTTPTCQTPGGETFFGGIKLTFQQP